MFSLSASPLNRNELMEALANEGAGAIVVFEGWVRNHNQGKQVQSLEYQVYEELALKEGEKILQEACVKFNLKAVDCVHRHGHLQLGEIAIWIGATAAHRDDAFKATRFVIDEIKHRLPVWKKEHYVDEKPEWVFCKHHHHHVHFTETDYYQKQKSLVNQNKLKESKVLVVGAGGLGCPALLGLAAAGVGRIDIMDFDKINISNLHRQILYSLNLVGEQKATVAKARLLELNPFIQSDAINARIDESNVLSFIQGYDLILDCTDNMQTKYLLHDACFKEGLPLISAGVFKFEGQIRTFLPKGENGCLRCQVQKTPVDGLLGNCNDFGVLGAVTNSLGSLQANEAISFLQTKINSTLTHTLFMNFKDLDLMKVKNVKAVDCPTCEGKVEIINNELEVGIDILQQKGIRFLDIRELADHEIESFKHSDQPVILCCHRGVRSKKLAEDLRAEGHSHFYSLKGGACSL